MPEVSRTFKRFESYAFEDVDNARNSALERGFDIIDFGVGDPTDPLYEGAVKGLMEGAQKHKSSGYPSYIGMPEFREKISDWMENRFDVSLDPETQITSTLGSKEAVWHLPFVYVNHGEKNRVLMPAIGYPPYKSGTVFAGGWPTYYNLTEETGFLPDLEELKYSLKQGVLQTDDVKMMWINSPHNPTTVKAPGEILERAVSLAQEYDFILASDEAYSEMYPSGSEKPLSVLEVTDDWKNLIVFQSLSKRSNATGIRVGFAAGDEDVISNYKKIRTQKDSGTANAIQEAAIYAWRDEEHVDNMRRSYDRKRDLITGALKDAGMDEPYAEATFYIWQPLPEEVSSSDFSSSMLQLSEEEKLGINTTPGSALSLSGEYEGKIPGEGYVRFALVPSEEDTERAAEAIRKNLPEKLGI